MKKIIEKINHLFDAMLWQPLRGGNGVTQMSELAQYISIWLLVWMVVKEGFMSGDQFTDMEFMTVAGLVAAISGFRLFNQNDKKS